MYFDKATMYKNRITISITIFIALLLLIHYIKPNMIYNKDGSFMEFGVGYSNKTIFPIWLVIIILALLCYMAVMFAIYKL
jgi:hypothetical protein